MTDGDGITHDELRKIVEGYCDLVQAEFHERMSLWPFDIAQNQVRETIGALLSRQSVLAQQMACSSAIWNGHIAPLLLRAMADVHISIVWIMGSPVERAKAFILYGLGQQKLELEHRKDQMASRQTTNDERDYVRALESWINRERAEFLTEVNLGNWSGISTRKMAEEAGCLEFYNYVFSPFSSCVHSTWHHVARYNLVECNNPLHGMHRAPQIVSLDPDTHYFYLAAKYLRKSFVAFDTKYGISPSERSAFDWLCEVVKSDERQDANGN